MKVLVTGAAGFAGSHLAQYLLSQGEEVVALVRHADDDLTNLAPILPHLRLLMADIRDASRIRQVLQDTRPARIYHLAAMPSPSHSLRDPRLTYEVNFLGTLNLLAAWRELEFDCRFLFVSSAEVYGSVGAESLPLREGAPINPSNPYGASKAAGELLARQFFTNYGLPIVRVRPFNHTGPRQASSFVCSSFARQIAEISLGLRQPVVMIGNSGVRRDFTDVRDIVRGYHLLLERGEAGDVYQLCSGRAVAVETVLQVITAAMSNPPEVVVAESMVRAQESSELFGDPSKAEREVGWGRQFELDITLHDLKLYWENRLRSEAALASRGTLRQT